MAENHRQIETPIKPQPPFSAKDKNHKLAALTGLAEEARLLAHLPVVAGCSAADARAARRRMAGLIAAGGTHCLSFGYAGGLEPGLPSGSIVIGSHVIGRNGSWECHGEWTAQLAAALPEAHVGGIRGADAIMPIPAAKEQTYLQSQCLVIDMESHIVAEIAAAYNLPFTVLRVVCDPVEFTLPPAAMLPIKPTGEPSLRAILRSVLRQPWQMPALIGLARHHRRAHHALRQATRALEGS